MNYHKITQYDCSNGPGIRTVLWVSGCNHHCLGCHNPDTWDPNSGKVFTTSALDTLVESLSSPYISGLTVSGGDPLYVENRITLAGILSHIKSIYPNKSIWLYTGYKYEDISYLPILDYVDVLVDGQFILGKKDITLLYRGSSNQRLIDVPKTRKLGEVVLWHSDL